MKKVTDSILTRVYALFGLFLLLGVAVVLRVMLVQVNHDHWVQKELDEQVFFKKTVADRGNILAEDGAIMATSLPFYRIALDPTQIDTAAYPHYRDSLWALSIHLTRYLDSEEKRDTLKYFEKIIHAMHRGDRHVYLTRNALNYRELSIFKQWPILNLGRYKGGLVVEKIHNKRYYPFEELAKITLGKVAHDTAGIRGVEAAYNQELRGKDGYILAQKIRGGDYIPLHQYGQEASIDGMDIRTTLDVDLQDMVEDALKEGVEKHDAHSGAAILLEVKTGKIKAIANYPENYNYAVAMLLEPGSTFKLPSAMAVLEDGIMGPCDSVDTGEGKITFDDKEITDGYAYGKLSFEQVFYKSSNVGMAKIVSEAYDYEQGAERYLWHLERLGLTEPANNQLIGEPKPVVHRPGDKVNGKPLWTIASLPSMAIGYSIQVTPLQMASAFNTIANNGTRMRPWLVKEIRDNAEVVRTFGPEVMQERVCGSETVRQLREMMTQVTDKGTARGIKGTPFLIAGKTGTARKTENGKYVKKYIASFGGFFPAQDPRYTLYIMVNEPRKGAYYGGDVAAPIFKKIATQIYKFDWNLSRPKHKHHSRPIVHPSPRAVYVDNAKPVFEELNMATSIWPDSVEYVRTTNNGHQINLSKMSLAKTRIPNLKGMTARDAMHLLDKMGVAVRLKGYGRVKRQSLLPGYRIGRNTSITLYLG